MELEKMSFGERAQNLSEFEAKIGIGFFNQEILRQIFVHRSYAHENGRNLKDNERLEFLGDSILSSAVSLHLYTLYPHFKEGQLAFRHDCLVNNKMLASVAYDMHLNHYLLVSKQFKSRVTSVAYKRVLADTFEAVVGGLYLDLGTAAVDDFLKKSLFIHADGKLKKDFIEDSRLLILNRAEKYMGVVPVYQLASKPKKKNNEQYIVSLALDGRFVSRGFGKSIEEAEQSAAWQALRIKRWV